MSPIISCNHVKQLKLPSTYEKMIILLIPSQFISTKVFLPLKWSIYQLKNLNFIQVKTSLFRSRLHLNTSNIVLEVALRYEHANREHENANK